MLEIILKNIDAKTMVGMHIATSPAASQAQHVWQEFMPRRAEIHGPNEDVYYSIQDYPSDYPWKVYDPTAQFTTWAAKEASVETTLPKGFTSTQIEGGLYAHFIHKGTVASVGKSMMDFHTNWLPNSEYVLDRSRKHFEKLGKNYLGPDNPASEEEVYIPILPNTNI